MKHQAPKAGTMDRRTAINRRKVLKGMGSLAIGLTTNIWKPATAFGADANAKAPMHFFGIFSANGTIPSAFFSDSTAADSPIKLGEILSPLSPYASNMLVLKGVEYRSIIENKLYSAPDGIYAGDPSLFDSKPGGPHMKGPAAFLTGGSLLHGNFGGADGPAGWADRMSLDQLLAKRLGGSSRFASLEFGVLALNEEPLRCISYADTNIPNLPVQDPWAMYTRMFGDGSKSPEQLARQLSERKSILDALQSELSQFQSRLGSEDKAKLDAHLTGIRSLETQLTAMGNGQCVAPTMPQKYAIDDRSRFADLGRLQTDLMILGHACGFTQISTFMWGNANSHQTYPWIGVPDDHHSLSHAPFDDLEDTGKLIKINKWTAEQVAYLLGKLKDSPSASGGSIFDNTVLLWGNELGAGNSHTYRDIPFVIAGGAGGYFKMGRSIHLSHEPHNNVLVSVANAMGLTDVTSFGIPGVCTGPTKGLAA